MNKFILAGLIVGSTFTSNAQDFHFSQVLQAPNLLNPGAVGVYDGWERYAVQHRNQWLGGNTTWMSTGCSADITLMKDMYRPKAHLGVGLQFYNDIGGAAKFGTQNASLTLSGILPTSNGTLSLGIQTGMGSRRGDPSKLLYESQWNTVNSTYDPTFASGETPGLSSFNYLDASTGIFYSLDGENVTFARNNNMKLQFGASVYHLNAPKMKYRTGSSETLNRKYVVMANFGIDIPNTKWAYDVQAVQFVQGGHFETIFGGVIKRRFEEGSKQTGFKRDASVGLGMYTRLKDAIVPTIQIDYRGFHFGISYDVTLSALGRAYKGGSLEFTLSYTNIKHALFTTRRLMR